MGSVWTPEARIPRPTHAGRIATERCLEAVGLGEGGFQSRGPLAGGGNYSTGYFPDAIRLRSPSAFARLSELRRTSPPVGPLTKPSPDGVSYGERAAHLLGAMTGPRKRAVASKPS
jgi:hypothetical protein